MAIPQPGEFERFYEDRVRSAHADAVALYSLWVSELEPELFCYFPGTVEGIRVKGTERTVFTREQAMRMNHA